MVSSSIWESEEFEIENRDIMVLVDNCFSEKLGYPLAK